MSGGPQLVADWRTRLRNRVFQQFKQSNWAIPLAELWGDRAQRLQGAFGALLQSWSIDPVTSDPTDPAYGVGRGVQLDRIGKLLVQPRAGLDDDTYRYLLRAEALARKSNGAPDTLIAIFKAMFNGQGAPLYTPGGTKQFSLQLVGVVTSALLGPLAAVILGEAEPSGSRGILIWQQDVDAAMFRTATAGYGSGTNSAGSGSMVLIDATMLPSSGQVIIDQGTVTEETISYSSRTATTLTLIGTLAQTHTARAVVSVVTPTAPAGLPYPVRCTFTSTSTIAGVTSLPVTNTAGFFSGQAVIDQGTAFEETVTYTTIDGTHLGIAAGTVFGHVANAAVVLIGSGGKLASAAQG